MIKYDIRDKDDMCTFISFDTFHEANEWLNDMTKKYPQRAIEEGMHVFKHEFETMLEQYENTGLTPAEVAELAQAKEDGLLLVVPCKVETPIWYIDASVEPNDKGKWITRYRIKSMKFDYSVLDWIDTPILFTKAEAQAALDRMEGQE